MKIMIVVPVYNENFRAVDTINRILKKTKNDVVVVDDGSGDDTWKVLKKRFGKHSRITLLSHVINLGKGAAMKTGVKMAWRMGAEAVIFVDADGQHNPSHLIKFEKELENIEIVFGYRSMASEMPMIRKWGNIFSISLIKTFFGIKRADLLCGYFGFRKSVYKKLRWNSSRYGVETEIACRVGKNQIPFSEVKIDTIYIDKYKGVTIFDAFNILLKLPSWYISK